MFSVKKGRSGTALRYDCPDGKKKKKKKRQTNVDTEIYGRFEENNPENRVLCMGMIDLE